MNIQTLSVSLVSLFVCLSICLSPSFLPLLSLSFLLFHFPTTYLYLSNYLLDKLTFTIFYVYSLKLKYKVI